MTQSRRPNIQQHTARPNQPIQTSSMAAEDEEERMAYIDFINKLMHRMRTDSIKRMLESALVEIK